METEAKLSAARTRLILDRPFLGSLVLRLEMRPASWCRTVAVDSKHFHFNPSYIDALSIDQIQFVLAHEALHCALSHFSRRQHRVRSRWDVACDLAINPILAAEGLPPPPGVMILPLYEGMTAEEIYPEIPEDSEQSTLDEHLYGDTASTEMESLSEKWKQRMASAAQQAKQAGKLSELVSRLVEAHLEPKLPWRSLLARHLNRIAREDFSYQRPSRREGEMILPTLRSRSAEIAVVIDTSGSIGAEEMKDFVSELDALKGQVGARILLHAADCGLDPCGPWIYESWEAIRLPEKLQGGGGTDFRPAFEWAAKLYPAPDLFVYFTDAQGQFPEYDAGLPVLWLVKGPASIPWGERIQLN
ncbi:MAG: hypothetical protein HKL98_03225 [Burkholderiales bacterium]|nr:hypothetical protein [Burkholderiales bacterium]